eukprot:CAMPEP_0118978044 /NCGR_PEP_ID=MMETSP1173-20130426/22753_1 /TAXON_ID=1034831 /ORGANISM="Rhizochromulina marina cf, Strain CCMP1243" /LENGTH=280 /DNA_ID=CAMNT_0006928209 /DNA_START=70 /DNA_END=908 /DNA_ORIENTATION=-
MARTAAVASVAAASLAWVIYTMSGTCGTSSALAMMGFRWATLGQAVGIPLGVISSLYAGPIAVLFSMALVLRTRHPVWLRATTYRLSYVDRPTPLSTSGALWESIAYTLGSESSHVHFRNLVVGPLFEELVFRACMIPMLIFAGVRERTILFLAPLVFCTAHAHHILEKAPRIGVARALQETAGQQIYTYIFGVLSGFIFMRTGHLSAPIIWHVICNFLQLPDPSFHAPEGQYLSPLYPSRWVLSLVYCLGIGAFFWSMAHWTTESAYGPFDSRFPCREG